jgi:16S rRNA (cytosine967-C5)-methyltransferase
MADISGLPARRAALQLCDAVLRRGETLEQAARSALRSVKSPPDKALALAIAGEVLRWLTDLDALIDSATRKRLPDDAKPRAVLRLMLAQWLRLDTPPHAVVATGLPLLAGGPRRLAHGVFSTLTKKGVSLPEQPTLPDEVVARWGQARAASIASGLSAPPPLDLTMRDAGETDECVAQLGGSSLMPGHVRLPRGRRVEELPGFAEGAWWVQDLAASLPARLLGPGEGRSALDLCAAPGGKTMQLAASGWNVTSVDISPARKALLKENLARTGLSATVMDVDVLEVEFETLFDAILLDAPCTATGTCRRHPDVLHRIGPRQIAEMAVLQSRMIERAIAWLKPGGVLVYAVCSLESEEGEGQAARISLPTLPVSHSDLPEGVLVTPEGWLRTDPGMLPDHDGLDGFFIARFAKTQ